MKAEQWAQVKELVADALERPVPERASFLARACGDDVALRNEVDSLLSAADGPDSLPDVRAAIGDLAARALGADFEGALEPAERDTALLAILETALGQQYEIIRALGRGGMGAVYLARERALERFVAIKVLRPDLANAPDSRERFRREARVVAQLSHPGILPLHTFGEVRGVWYFVMGYVRGVSLAERLRVEGRLSSGEAHRILAEIVDAVDCAHRHGVIHRDIKPANILLDEQSGRAMLADFGISKVHGGDESLTAAGAVIGTPHFMSPEQSLGSPKVDERSDIYSIGAVGYTMLAGHEPFAGTSADQITWRRLSNDPEPLTTVAPGAPSELSTVIMRSLARDPAARWPDARTLRNALSRAGGDSSVNLPESLRDLPGFGPYTLLWAAFWIAVAVRAMHSPGDRALLLLIALLVPLGLLLHIWNVGRSEVGTTGLAKIAFWPPEWWGMWWPRALRRPSDLWRRLPWPARLVRAVLSAFTITLPVVILFRQELETAARPFTQNLDPGWFVDFEMALVLGAAAITAAALWWAWRLGLTRSEGVRLLFGATTPSPGWNVPNVARLLAPVTLAAVRPPDSDSPADHRRAISEVARAIPGFSDTRERVTRLAEKLLREIESLDVQVAALSRDANAGELERLTTQLAALESEPDPNSERRQLATLVRQQLEVVRRMRIQCELIAQRRAKLFSLLRGVWTKLSRVRDHSSETEEGTVSDRMRDICEDVEAALAA